MVVEVMSLNAILSALSVVYQAYNRIKSNKERCKQLLERCELITNRLRAIYVLDNNTVVTRRVEDLERAFKLTADTITKVGQQSYVVSLLRTEENAALIEDAQRALTELITILSLETIIDVSTWQRENDAATRREYNQMRSSIRSFDQSIDSIRSELATHGATLEQLRQTVRDIYERLGDPLSPTPLLDESTPQLPNPGAHPRTRSWSSPVGVRPSRNSLLPTSSHEAPSSSLATTTESRPQRARHRVSWAYQPGNSPHVSSASPGNDVLQREATSPLSPRIPPPHMREPLPLPPSNPDIQSEAPQTPPPAYSAVALENELAATYARRINEVSRSSSSSTEAVRSDSSPVPSPSSAGFFDFDRSLPDDGIRKVRESLKRKDITNFSAMKTIGHFGNVNTKILVEMWMFPKIRTLDRAISLDYFEPTMRDKLQLIQSRAHGNRESQNYVLGNNSPNARYNHVLLLCPKNAKPVVVVISDRQQLPQQSVKAYIIDAVDSLTLVSVKKAGKLFWLLIPYYPEMVVWKAKEYVQRHFGDVIIDSCSFTGQPSQLDDNSTLFETGVQAYSHNLSMTASAFV